MNYKNQILETVVLTALVVSLNSVSANEEDQSITLKLSQMAQDQMEQEIIDAISDHLDDGQSKDVDKKVSQSTEDKSDVLRKNIIATNVVVEESEERREKPKQTTAKPKYNQEKKSPQKNVAAPTPRKASRRASSNTNQGWVYVGQFSNNQWLENMLVIGNSVPKVGERYQINHPVHIRDALPSKGKLSKSVTVLGRKNTVKLADVRRVGSKGHYWAQVEW